MSEPAKTWRQWAADSSVDFWDCSEDQEQLAHEALEEAIESFIEDSPEAPSIEAWLRERFAGGLKVHGFRRKAVTQKWRAWAAGLMAESFSEAFDDEYGGGDAAAFDDVAQESLEAELLLLVEKLPLVPWQCERVVTVTIPLDELLAALRKWRSDWFEVTP